MLCTAIIEQARIVNTPNGDEETTELIRTSLCDLASVIDFLKTHRDATLTEIADEIAAGKREPVDRQRFGGYTVTLENRRGCVVEVALGPKYSLFMQILPKPLWIYRNGPDSDETMDFFISGGHHTEFHLRDLVRSEDCIDRLAEWLESGESPEASV